MRLNAYIAKAGVTSRRKADELIKAGRVKVNNKSGQLNDEVDEHDEIMLDGKKVELQAYRYILLNKPSGYVTTLHDPQGRPKILDLLSISERVVPAGRLDADTTGVLILSNNGELIHKLTHPGFEVDKVYEVVVKGSITDAKLQKLRDGIKLKDGLTSPARARKISENKVQLTVHEGRKHQVKRMLRAVGLPVASLHRTAYAGLNLEGLKPGEWRDLTAKEIIMLE